MKMVIVSLCALPVLALAGTTPSTDACTVSPSLTGGAVLDKQDIVDTAIGAGNFKTLAAALQAAELVEALRGKGPFTVFAPTDAAFAKVPANSLASLLEPKQRDTLKSILTYHVVSGTVSSKDVVKLSSATTLNGQRLGIQVVEGVVYIDGAKVVTTDIQCSNGIIHVIDTVVLPVTENVVAKARSAGTFGTLLAAVEAAGLSETLMGKGPFTVFAPSDDAFAKLPGGTVENLLKRENLGQLQDILKNHVVSGRVFSDQALKAGEAQSLLGKTLMIRKDERGAFVGSARLVALDIQASNGVIHVIDSVLLPQ